VTITDGHVRLRELRLDDEQRYLETINDPESQRWLGTIPFPRNPAGFSRYHETQLASAVTTLAAVSAVPRACLSLGAGDGNLGSHRVAVSAASPRRPRPAVL
jgi:hypothetical protein